MSDPNTGTNDELTRWLEGVKRYARTKGMTLNWEPLGKDLFTQPTVHGDTAKKNAAVVAGKPAEVVTGTKESAFRHGFESELEKIAEVPVRGWAERNRTLLMHGIGIGIPATLI